MPFKAVYVGGEELCRQKKSEVVNRYPMKLVSEKRSITRVFKKGNRYYKRIAYEDGNVIWKEHRDGWGEYRVVDPPTDNVLEEWAENIESANST